jgi:hypothetical protein
VLLQWCYSGVTVVLQWCYSGVTVALQWCYTLRGAVARRYVTWRGEWCYSGVTVVLQWCCSGDTVVALVIKGSGEKICHTEGLVVLQW